jgi:hypothetical protein
MTAVVVAWDEVAVAEPLLRAVVEELTGRDPGPTHHRCPRCGSVEHGAPYVDAPVEVSAAHATGLTVVAVSLAGPVGIDVEWAADRDWVRAEAVGKAHRSGIVVAPTLDSPDLWVADLDLDVGPAGAAVAAVAGLSPRRPEVRAARRRAATR